jgi:hypothetical protein
MFNRHASAQAATSGVWSQRCWLVAPDELADRDAADVVVDAERGAVRGRDRALEVAGVDDLATDAHLARSVGQV